MLKEDFVLINTSVFMNLKTVELQFWHEMQGYMTSFMIYRKNKLLYEKKS